MGASAEHRARRGNRGDRTFWETFRTHGAGAVPQRALLTLPAPGIELFEENAARHLAALANDRLAAPVNAGGAAAGFATLSSRDPHAAREAERAIKLLRLTGLSLGVNPRRGSTSLNSGRSTTMPRRGASRSICRRLTPRPRAGSLTAHWARRVFWRARQLIFGGVLDAFPRLTVVLARLGEATPYWHSEISAIYSARRHAGARVPRHHTDHYFKVNIALTTADIQSVETLAYCSGVIGGRLLASPHTDEAIGRIARVADANGEDLFRA